MRYGLIVATLLLALPALAADYWPFHPDGVVYHYEHSTATYGHNGEYSVIEIDTPSGCHGELYYVELDGRAALCSYGSYCPGDFEGTIACFDPPLPVTPVDATPGSVWIWESNQWGYPFIAGLVIGQVVGEETVTVPAGTFTCLHVTLTGINSSFQEEFYLDFELGPIIWYLSHLVSIDGLTPTETTSWGAVKSLFR
jgi:hypothetical protein